MIDTLTKLDADQKERAYQGLVKYYVNTGDAWPALHAQVTSDFCAATIVLSELNVDEAPNLVNLATELQEDSPIVEGLTPSEVLDVYRVRIYNALPEVAQHVWRERVGTINVFGELETLSPETTLAMADARFEGRTPEEFVSQKFGEADQHMVLAKEHHDRGAEWDAVLAAYSADLAAFEAWLFEHSIITDDTSFVVAEIRWTLAVKALEGIVELPTEVNEAMALVRSRLAWVLGPKDARELVWALPKLA